MTIPRFQQGQMLTMESEWEPDVPHRLLSKREIADYRRGRDAVLSEVAKLIGGNVMCVEV
ncbi:MAG: hypothetical protein H6905_09660 [Hyphomicrobiales bacterium]|nr:hypothetical protein [Hyphomicrobiales bacterium]